jgi:hypothetical protein
MKIKNIGMRLCCSGLLLAVVAAPVRLLAAPAAPQQQLRPACEDDSSAAKDDSTGELRCPATEPSMGEDEHGDLILSERWEKRSSQEPYWPSEQELRLFYPPGSRRPLWGY